MNIIHLSTIGIIQVIPFGKNRNILENVNRRIRQEKEERIRVRISERQTEPEFVALSEEEQRNIVMKELGIPHLPIVCPIIA